MTFRFPDLNNDNYYDPEEEFIVARDWKGDPIFSGTDENFYATEDGYVSSDAYELDIYLKYLFGDTTDVGGIIELEEYTE